MMFFRGRIRNIIAITKDRFGDTLLYVYSSNKVRGITLETTTNEDAINGSILLFLNSKLKHTYNFDFFWDMEKSNNLIFNKNLIKFL